MPDPVIGQLFPSPSSTYPAAKQPGGVGTAVTDPAQTINEKTGYFFPGCGHSIRSWLITRVAIGGVPSALVQCPVCSYVQNIYTPASLLDAQEIILG